MEQSKFELAKKAWLNLDFLQERIKEEEIIEIDDYVSVMIQEETKKKADSQINQEQIKQLDKYDEHTGTIRKFTDNLAIKPYLSFVPDQKKDSKPTDKERNEVKKVIERLLRRPFFAKRQLCELYIYDQVYHGYVERVEDHYLYLKQSFGISWKRFPIADIYRVKIIS